MRLKRYRTVIREMAFATKAFGKERELAQHLQSHDVMDTSSKAAGASARDADFHLNVGGKRYHGEFKQDMRAGMGQMELRHNGKKWNPSTKSIGGEGGRLLKHWKSAGTTVNGRKVNYHNHLNRQWGKPGKDYESSVKSHKSVYSDWGPAHGMVAHYRDRGVHYVQIGNELFHTHKDEANLGTTHLAHSGIEARYRSRVKGRGHNKKTGKMNYGYLTTMESRRKKGAKASSASLYNPETLNKIKSIKPSASAAEHIV